MRKNPFTLTKLALLCLPAVAMSATSFADQATAYAASPAKKSMITERADSDVKRYIIKYKQQGLALQQNGNAGMALQQVANTLQQKGLRVHHVLAPQSAVAADLRAADLAALQADPTALKLALRRPTYMCGTPRGSREHRS